MHLSPKLKEFGAVLLIIGTSIGAGMLALPIPGSGGGALGTSLGLAIIASLLLYTALIVLEVNTMLPEYRNSFASMARATLGKSGKFFVIITTLLLLYSLAAAYMEGMGSLLSALFTKWNIHLSPESFSALFTFIFGLIVYLGTLAVDKVNQVFIFLKITFLALAFFVLVDHMQAKTLLTYQLHPSFVVRAAPIFITAFGFHTIIPSITNYLGRNHYRSIRRAIFIGGLIPLVIYIAWIIVVFSIIPQQGKESFSTIHENRDSIALLIQFLEEKAQSPFASAMIDTFSNISMTTSFLGVTLGLFDFLADTCKRENHPLGRLQTALLTFIPPLCVALFYPQGFVLALNYASIFVAVLLIVVPAVMVIRKRSLHIQSPYEVKGNNLVFAGTILIGLVLVVLAFVPHHLS